MKIEDATSQDVFRKVRIKAPIMEAWINSLAEIAVSLRLKNQVKVVDIEQDQAFVKKTGDLMMATSVNGEPVRMVIPSEMWSFSDN
ncbi:MAG: hypothetical protein HXX11_23070 [Desulfuromonadales bacterium]|nr:hypothetical protein [Desulfuromonadales bacterium]